MEHQDDDELVVVRQSNFVRQDFPLVNKEQENSENWPHT